MPDFNLRTYINLLERLQQQAFSFLPFCEFITASNTKALCLRHDVDLLPSHSLAFAKTQYQMGMKGSYFFRAVPESWDEEIIKEIHSLGHEVGYHYENLTTCKGDIDFAIRNFEINLDRLRQIVPVKTICMHGSPRSSYDSKDLWRYADYRDYGLVAEPYFDMDFSKVLYLTDTGRRWNGGKVSVRDKATTYANATVIETMGRDQASGRVDIYANWKVKPPLNSSMNMTQEAIDFQKKYNFRSTGNIIRAAEEGKLPDKIMMTFHPQRWTNKPFPWMKELVWQNTKNIAKFFLIKLRK